MSVALLLCEGEANSLDVRLLKLILGGAGPKVEPNGSKWGMAHRIRALRGAQAGVAAFGLLDGDFGPAERAVAEPSLWNEQGLHLGWRWRRKEVENYLLDPIVVERAMSLEPPKKRPFDLEGYRGALHAARDALAVQQAARVALDLSRPDRTPSIDNALRPEDAAGIDAWRAVLTDRVEQYLAGCRVEPADVLARFEALRVESDPGGWRHRDFLVYFAGKDLSRALHRLDPSLNDIPTQVLRKIERSAPDDITDWLPEWRALANAVASGP